MILVRTDWPSFDAYLASLSRRARKNYKEVMRAYDGFAYQTASGDFPLDDVRTFMRLWEQQLVKGKTIQWAFPVETVENWWKQGNLFVARAMNLKTGEICAMHFIQKREGYWECHPPMYDKEKYPSLAKMMWFWLIRYAIEHKFDHLDLGGMSDDWHYNLRTWRDYKHQYKWHYVPHSAKEDPESEPHYYIGKPLCKLMIKN